jgi:dihydroorotate dehydrogenase
MGAYRIARKALFRLPPEIAHGAALAALRLAGNLSSIHAAHDAGTEDVKGLRVLNRVGLAAGFDKNGVAIDGIGRLGFGFIEIGTVTPHPQPGNRKPRLHRLPGAEALINGMGFPNDGAAIVAARVRRRRYRGAVGVNIGKNATTSIDAAAADYLAGYEAFRDIADYIVVNVSSPNTANLRSLQEGARLDEILGLLAGRRRAGPAPKLLLKIAPDLADAEIDTIATACLRHGIDGVVATNTTLTRDGLPARASGYPEGGLSGAPLRQRAVAVVRCLRAGLGPAPLLIGCGGIMCPDDACAYIDAGADLVQLYTGLVYRGPGLVRACAHALREMLDEGGGRGVAGARAGVAPRA